MNKSQQFARDNYKVGESISEMWSDAVVAECVVMQREAAEAEAKKNKSKKRIKEVVESVADISAELTGRIVVRVSFAGSLPKTKKLTADEKKLVMNLPEGVKVPIGGDKPLFTSKEYDDLVSFIAKRRIEFASFGIPHIKFEAANVVDITHIPEIEELAEKTVTELAGMVDKLIEVYPDQITPDATKLGPLYNPRDYKPVEALKGMFKIDYDWMSFGVPEELKQFNPQIYARAKKKAEATWKEIEANGVLLLRHTVSDLVGGLVESLTPKDGGDKKKFYASSVTKITDFIENFSRRNICNDSELDTEVEKLKGLVTGIDLKSMSTDMGLRDKVKKQMETAQTGLQSLLVSASARVIKLRD